MQNKKVVVITGASSGIGLETANKFKNEGYIVYDLSINKNENSCIDYIYCDVSNFDDIQNAINEIINKEGRIDIAISNAGFGISGSLECNSNIHIEKQIDVNFKGSAYFAKIILPYIRESKGKIIFMSSIAGIVPIPFQAIYSATKAAILNMAMCLENEIKDSGAKVIVMLPGDVSTGFTKARIKNANEDAFYLKKVESSVGKMEKDEINGMQPSEIASKIYNLVNKRNPSLINTVGIFYNIVLKVANILPIKLKQYIIRKMYA